MDNLSVKKVQNENYQKNKYIQSNLSSLNRRSGKNQFALYNNII